MLAMHAPMRFSSLKAGMMTESLFTSMPPALRQMHYTEKGILCVARELSKSLVHAHTRNGCKLCAISENRSQDNVLQFPSKTV